MKNFFFTILIDESKVEHRLIKTDEVSIVVYLKDNWRCIDRVITSTLVSPLRIYSHYFSSFH